MSVFLADEQQLPVPAASLRGLAQGVLAAERLRPDTEVAIVLVEPAEMATYHERFLGKPGPTDVLALPIEDMRPGDPGRYEADDPPLVLGDVFLCPAVVSESAAAAGVPFEDHMALLVVHGLLHLLGYDHADDADADRMERREEELLAAWRTP